MLTAELEAMAREFAQQKAASGDDHLRADEIRFNRLMIADGVIYMLRAAARGIDEVERQLPITLEGIWKSRSRVRPGRTYPRVRKSPLRGYRH